MELVGLFIWSILVSDKSEVRYRFLAFDSDIRSEDLSRDGLTIKYEIDQGILNLICRSVLVKGLITDAQFASLAFIVNEIAV